MPGTDRRLGFCEVDVGIQKNSDVLVSSFQGNGEGGAAVLQRKGKQQASLSLSQVKQPEGNKTNKVPQIQPSVSPSGSVSGSFLLEDMEISETSLCP